MYYPKALKPRPILFDLGDTLINFSSTNPLPYMQYGTKLGYDYMADRGIKLPSFNSYLRTIRRSTYLAFALAEIRRREVDLVHAIQSAHRLLRLPIDDEFLLALAGRFYEPIRVLGRVEEGIHPIFEEFVRVGHPMAIVSNTMVPGRLLDQHLEQEGLLKYFPVRIYSCDIGIKKPNPKAFRAALQALNVRPEDSLFVGDKPRLDIRGAKRVGMITVLKVRKRPIPHVWDKPDYVVRHLTELPSLLEKIGVMYEDSMPTLPNHDYRRSGRVWQKLPSGSYSGRIRVTSQEPPA